MLFILLIAFLLSFIFPQSGYGRVLVSRIIPFAIYFYVIFLYISYGIRKKNISNLITLKKYLSDNLFLLIVSFFVISFFSMLFGTPFIAKEYYPTHFRTMLTFIFLLSLLVYILVSLFWQMNKYKYNLDDFWEIIETKKNIFDFFLNLKYGFF